MSKPTHTIEDLKGPEVERSLQIDWTIQRAGWLLMVGVIVAALLGYLGRGPLTHQHARATDQSLSVEYYSIERYESPTELRIRIDQPPAEGEPLRLRVSKAFCDVTTVEQISPPPLRSTLVGDDVVYDFAVGKPEELMVVYRFKHDDTGSLVYTLAVGDGEPVTVQQYILP